MRNKKYLKAVFYTIERDNVFERNFNDNKFFNINLSDRYSVSLNKIYETSDKRFVRIRLITEPLITQGLNVGEKRFYKIWDRENKISFDVLASEISTFINNLKNSNIVLPYIN